MSPDRAARDLRVRRETEADPDIFNVDRWRRISPNGLEPNTGSPEQHDELDRDQIAACRLWIRKFAIATARIQADRPSSYGYKHMVENWTRGWGPYVQKDRWGRVWTGDYLYVSNGAFIEAARLEGYRFARCRVGSLNADLALRVRRGAE